MMVLWEVLVEVVLQTSYYGVVLTQRLLRYLDETFHEHHVPLHQGH